MPKTKVNATAAHGVAERAHVREGIELEIAAELARAFLLARQPVEVCRLALARVAPLLGARFASVYLRDAADPTAMRLQCAYSWPQDSARWLGQLRIRESRGPTGIALATDAVVEVPDVFADAALQEWWEPARELGFVSIIALPLKADAAAAATADGAQDGAARETIGAVSFYFEGPRRVGEPETRLLRLVADQLAAAAAKVRLLEELRTANDELRATNAELRRRLEEFEAAKRLKDEFLGTITHELRTPLTTILGYAHLLGEGLCGPLGAPQASAASKIESAGRVLLRLITDIVDLAQLKLGQMRPDWQREDGVTLARRALDEVGAPPAGVTVAVRAHDTGVIVVTDGEKVARVLTHLVRNAYKFTGEGSVTIEVARGVHDGSECVEWAVRDTGIGIRPEDVELVFDEFRQADGSTTRPYGGAGLGLALARRFAALLGGCILVESTPGRGSTFTLRLPLLPHPRS
jgi:signal transduction histidine kinase